MARRSARPARLHGAWRRRAAALLALALCVQAVAACAVGTPSPAPPPPSAQAATAAPPATKPASADRRTRPSATPTSEAQGFTVVATGLVNPRGLAFGPDGALYVAEGGRGGPRAVELGRKRPHMVGQTGRVSVISPGGQLRPFVSNLPAIVTAAGEEVGPAGLASLDGALYLLTASGGWDIGDPSFDSGVFRLAPTGELTSLFDLTRFNLREPPLSRKRDSRADVPGGMPFGMAAMSGALYITDGNHESILRLTPDGQPRRILEFAASDQALTGIVAGPDGNLYVSAYVPGKALRVRPSGEWEEALSGLALPIGLAFDRGGRLCALEYVGQVRCFAPHSQDQSPGETVASGLNQPTAIIAGPDGALYISNRGHFSVNGEGEIVRVAVR